MLLGLVAFVCLGRASEARASCGYYVIIGHPSADAAAEQARMRHEQMPLEQRKAPCNGPQCRRQNQPMTPAPAVTISLQDPMAVKATAGDCDKDRVGFGVIDEFAFLSDPHIWRIDPPPRF